MTLLTTLNDEIIKRFDKIGSKSSKLFVDINKNYAKLLNENFNIPFGSMHDSVAVITLADESIVKYKKAKVEVDLSHGCSYGRTNCNFLIKEGIDETNVEVSVEIDVEKFWNLVEELYKKY